MDLFSPYAMLDVVETAYTPKLVFRKNIYTKEKISNTRHVIADTKRRGRKLAPIVNPEREGKVSYREDTQSDIIIPLYLKVKRPTVAGDALKRQPGEPVTSAIRKAPMEIAQELLSEDMVELLNQCERREEWLISQVFQSGKIEISPGDSGYDEPIVVDFQADILHLPALEGNYKWGGSDADILGNMEAWQDLVEKDSGYMADKCYMGLLAYQKWRADSSVLGLLDNRRMSFGDIQPKSMPDGSRYLGNFNGIEYYVYNDFYMDENGVLQRMWPTNKVLLVSSFAPLTFAYGAVEDIEYGGPSGLVKAKYFPKSWITPDPSKRWLMMQGAPVPIPGEINSFVCATVCDVE